MKQTSALCAVAVVSSAALLSACAHRPTAAPAAPDFYNAQYGPPSDAMQLTPDSERSRWYQSEPAMWVWSVLGFVVVMQHVVPAVMEAIEGSSGSRPAPHKETDARCHDADFAELYPEKCEDVPHEKGIYINFKFSTR